MLTCSHRCSTRSKQQSCLKPLIQVWESPWRFSRRRIWTSLVRYAPVVLSGAWWVIPECLGHPSLVVAKLTPLERLHRPTTVHLFAPSIQRCRTFSVPTPVAANETCLHIVDGNSHLGRIGFSICDPDRAAMQYPRLLAPWKFQLFDFSELHGIDGEDRAHSCSGHDGRQSGQSTSSMKL